MDPSLLVPMVAVQLGCVQLGCMEVSDNARLSKSTGPTHEGAQQREFIPSVHPPLEIPTRLQRPWPCSR
jgi:hypothetical protein